MKFLAQIGVLIQGDRERANGSVSELINDYLIFALIIIYPSPRNQGSPSPHLSVLMNEEATALQKPNGFRKAYSSLGLYFLLGSALKVQGDGQLSREIGISDPPLGQSTFVGALPAGGAEIPFVAAATVSSHLAPVGRYGCGNG